MQGKVCVQLGAKFDVIAVADVIPANGYTLAQVFIDYDTNGLVHKKNTVAIWPDVDDSTFLTAQSEGSQNAQSGGITGLLTQTKGHRKGDMYSFSLTFTTPTTTCPNR